MLKLSYTNSRGTAILCGGASPFHLVAVEGLGLPQAEYTAATYSGYDGQETLSSSYLPRTLTLSGDIVSGKLRRQLTQMLEVLSAPGYLYIQAEAINRRIYCNQLIFPEISRVLQGKISSFAFQLICDNPFFEGTEAISEALYSRTKELTTPFTLPCCFGVTVAERNIELKNRIAVEPKIRIICPNDLQQMTSICILNVTTDKKIQLDYLLSADEEIVIDVKNRTAASSLRGNIINYISDDTFLGEFRLEPFNNLIRTEISEINQGIFIECIYNDQFSEALLV